MQRRADRLLKIAFVSNFLPEIGKRPESMNKLVPVLGGLFEIGLSKVLYFQNC